MLFADIDLATQTMIVSDQSGVRYRWPISSARAGYETPVGKFAVSWTSRMHYSRQYDWAPMPYAVFFKKGVTVHATNAVGNLGRPASHGCVLLALNNARTFYVLVGKHGMALTQITVHGKRRIRPWWRSGAIGSRWSGRSTGSLPISSRPTNRVRAHADARSTAETGRNRARTGSRSGAA
jgi:L,D-transpeptidase catalytic domain